MTVYVDESIFPYRGTLYCHVWADTIPELHAAATKAGLRREWFQEPPKASWQHYDCAPRIRSILVENGAIETDRLGPSVWQIGRQIPLTWHGPTVKRAWRTLQQRIAWRAARPGRDLFADLTPEIDLRRVRDHVQIYLDREREFAAWWSRAVTESERDPYP